MGTDYPFSHFGKRVVSPHISLTVVIRAFNI